MNSDSTQPRRGSFGCLGYGCLVAFGLLTVVLSLIGWYLVSSIRGAVDTYTTPKKPDFQISAPADSARVIADEKMKRIAQLLGDTKSSGEVELSSSEVSSAARIAFGDVVDLELQGDQFKGRFAVQLRQLFGESVARVILGSRIDNYAFGDARGTMTYANRAITVKLSSLELGGRKQEDQALIAASEWFSQALTSFVAAAEREKTGPEDVAIVERLTELAIRDGVLVVRFKALE